MAKYCPLTVKQLAGVITLALAALCCASLCSCKTKYVSVPEYHEVVKIKHDSIYAKDSVYVHDSIFTERKGDTLYINKSQTKYVDRWRDVLRVDSFIKTDSIRVPYPVERKLTKWESFCIDYGKVTLGATILFVCFFIAYVLKKLGLFARFRI